MIRQRDEIEDRLREADADAEVERVCHKKQLRVWADELIEALAMGDFLKEPESYDDKIDLERVAMSEIKRIVARAFDHPERAT